MRQVSDDYKEVMNRNIRNRSYISIGLNVVNQEAQSSATFYKNAAYFSNDKSAFGTIYNRVDYATMEEDYIKANGTLYFVPREDSNAQFKPTGYISKDLHGAAVVAFDNTYTVKGLTIDFGEYYPSEFTIWISSGDKWTYTNNSSIFTCEDIFANTHYIGITPNKNKWKQKRLRVNSFTCGIGLSFGNSELSNTTFTDYTNGISAELPYQDFAASIIDLDNKFNIDNNNSYVNFLQEGQTINISYGTELDSGDIEWVKSASLNLETWKSQNGKLNITAKDKISTYNNKYDKGFKIYTRTAYQEAVNIFTDLGLDEHDYNIDYSLQDYVLTNPMPINSHAECLQLLCNACRAVISQDENGVIQIKGNFELVVDPSEIEVSATNQSYLSDLNSINKGAYIVYGDFSKDFIKADGTYYFPPRTNSQNSYSGFISNTVSDASGKLTNTKVIFKYNAAFNYYGLYVNFLGTVPSKITVNAYNSNNDLINSIVKTNLSQKTYIDGSFQNIAKLEIVINETSQYNRVRLGQVSFKSLSDYSVDQNMLLSNPVGYREKLPKNIFIKVHTFQNNAEGIPVLVEDDVWYKMQINPTGNNYYIENALVSTNAHAAKLAKWIGNYYANNTIYDASYRGDPRINSNDIVNMYSSVLNNLQTRIEKHTIKFNGAFSGELELHKALRLVGGN